MLKADGLSLKLRINVVRPTEDVKFALTVKTDYGVIEMFLLKRRRVRAMRDHKGFI